MKRLLLLLFIGGSIITHSQDTFKLDKTGFTDFVVVNLDSLKKQELFDKTINWIKETYNTPDKVIKAKIDNDKIIFQGVQSPGIKSKVLFTTVFYDLRYRIEISFKDGKYKFDPVQLELYSEPSKYSNGGWADYNLNGLHQSLYKKNGKLRKVFKSFPEGIENCFNRLLLSHQLYLKKQVVKKVTNKKDDW